MGGFRVGLAMSLGYWGAGGREGGMEGVLYLEGLAFLGRGSYTSRRPQHGEE